jgi:hypothetical protein
MLTCIYRDCVNLSFKVYIGQTGRDFHTRYDEHKSAFKYNTQQSKFAKHILDHKHTFGNIENTMEILQFQKKGTHLNTMEKFHIHKETLNNSHLNEEYTDTSNQIFNTILTKQQ